MARPEFQPTAVMRRQVATLAAAKMGEAGIAAVLGINRTTLRKHFADELLSGKSKRNAAVILAIYKQALGGNVSAQRLWVKVSGLDLPDAVNPDAAAEPKKAPRLGKKEQAQRDAETAGASSEWGDDLRFESARPN